MSQQNPIIPSPTQAKGIDLVVNDLQTHLSFDLSWLTNGMGRAYRRQKTRSNGALEFLPMVYLGTSESNFFNATPDNDKEGQSIIIVGDATPIDPQLGFYGWLQYPISIIFSANLNTIDSTLLETEDFTEHLMEDVRESITRNLLGKSYRVTIDLETRDFDSVYSEFDISVGKTSKPLLPMTYFRFNCTLTVKEDCTGVSLDRCAAILQNLTTEDKNECILPTYDFSNADVQSNVTAQQQIDLADWICTSMYQNDYSISFDGINEYVSFTHDAKYNFDRLTPFSFTARVKSNAYTVISPIIYKYNKPSVEGVQFTIGSIGDLRLAIYGGSAALAIVVKTVDPAVINGTPVHVAATYDGSGVAAGIKIYADGVSVPFSIVTDGLSSGTSLNTSALQIGGQPVSIARYSNATMNEVRAWTRELSAANVLDDYNLDTPKAADPTNNVLNWRCGDGAVFYGGSWYFNDDGISVNMDLTNRVAAI